MKRRTLLLGASALAGSASLPAASFAQDKYPSRPIRLVVPFPPGGPTDVLGRRYGERLAAQLGQTVVVDNKAGAGGTVGADIVAKAKPDGYTMLIGSSSTQVTSPLLMPQAPYDPVKDFTLFIIGFVPMVIACNPELPVKTLPELVALLKANPDKYRYSSSGMGSINHLGAELFKMQAGNLVSLHVPYKGNSPALQAALSGEVNWLLDTVGTSLGQYRSGKLRYLAICAERRSSVIPDVPTTAECGLPEVLVSTVNPVALPAATPAMETNVIADATRKIMSDPKFQEDLRAMSIEPVADADAAKSAAYFTAEMQRWKPIIEASGAKME
ncbi:Bug family tripartite tricarboxylate transporter substrate binding protein [Reyranella sp.]|uniref:Bug family tripartite tricarboxylate transporter substrate binding protein n=1 Tax=Reyranella sp. TaxID=1929291 RepID=UPI003BAC37D0